MLEFICANQNGFECGLLHCVIWYLRIWTVLCGPSGLFGKWEMEEIVCRLLDGHIWLFTLCVFVCVWNAMCITEIYAVSINRSHWNLPWLLATRLLPFLSFSVCKHQFPILTHHTHEHARASEKETQEKNQQNYEQTNALVECHTFDGKCSR